MANKILSLSEEDAEVLRRFIRELKQNPRPQSRYREEREIGQSPDVYVALTPTEGIPAVTDATGTGIYDVANSAECNVYRLVRDTNGQQLRQIDGLTRIIHSLSADDVPGDMYVLVERDKFGSWWISGTASNSATTPPTTPPTCLEVVVQETDLRCETTTGTGTVALGGSLNLYRRDVKINIESGCPIVSYGAWTFIRAVACCDPSCEQEESQESLWWCINDNEEEGDTAPTPGEDCATAPELDLGIDYGPYTRVGGVVPHLWFKFPTGLAGTHKIVMTVTALDNDGAGGVLRVWPGNNCAGLGMGNSTTIDIVGDECVHGTPATELWAEIDIGGIGATGSITFTIRLEAGSC